ncbi:MAG: O-antigen ligase family protein [Acidobacteriota bacterium]|nr:O-antigen ligase family protein [Acidobacteriota bacterium]
MRLAQGLLRWIVCSLVVLSPLPFGSVEPWAVAVFEIGAAVAGALALAVFLGDRVRLGRAAAVVLVLLLLVVAIGLFQLVPLPAGLATVVAPETADAREALAAHLGDTALEAMPVSIGPPGTLDATLRLLAYVLIGLATAAAVSRPAHVIPLTLAIVLSAVFQAGYGAYEYLTGGQRIFGYAKIYFLDEATGTFINRNHFAGYLAVALPFVLGLFLAYGRRLPAPRSWKERVVLATRSDRIKSLFLALCTLIITAGLLLSFSRGGFVVAAFAAVVLLIGGGVPLRKWRWAAAVMLLAAVFVTFHSIRVPGERFAELGDHLPTVSGRVPIWDTALRMTPSYWPVGSGLGTFGDTFRIYRPPQIDFHTRHAHSDWLQSLTEGGVVTTAVMLAALALVFAIPAPPSRAGSMTSMVRAATTAAIAGIALYSVFDFSLRIPAVAVLCAVVVGLRVGLAMLPVSDVDERPRGKLVYLPQ